MKMKLSVEEGRELILNEVLKKGKEQIAIVDAEGRVLAEDVVSAENVPPFKRSPLDGYALRAEDIAAASNETPVTLEIIEEVPAGYVAQRQVTKGTAIKILTGAPIPDGADIVVRYEDTEFTETEVTFSRPEKSGSNIVPEGEDIKAGDIVLKKGEKITPAVCGILAGLGYAEVMVYEKPAVSLLSTGSELISIGEPLKPGKIRNSSVYTLKAYLDRAGASTCLLGNVEDSIEAIAGKINEAVESADIVITTGGVSVGDYDYLIRAMEYLEADILFWKEKLKPGGAFLASVYKGTLIISLSGNPSAAVIAMLLNVVPAVYKMAGCNNILLREGRAKLGADYKKGSPSIRVVPGFLEAIDGEAVITLSGHSGNGMLHPLHGCNVLGCIEAGSKGKRKDELITFYYI